MTSPGAEADPARPDPPRPGAEGPGPAPSPPPGTARQPVPVRTILAAIGLVLATVLLLLLIRDIHRVLVWILIAGFFAVAVYPVVNWIERRVRWCRRSLATLAVY